MASTILQSEILTKFVYPFLLVFFIVFAVLEKTKILGGEKKTQLNALISFVIGLIFVSAVFPKIVVSNLILFLTIALVIMFVVLLLWGFVAGGKEGFEVPKGLKTFLMIVIGIAVVVAVFWALGVGQGFFEFLFKSSWSNVFWTNLLFLVVIAAALAFVLIGSKK